MKCLRIEGFFLKKCLVGRGEVFEVRRQRDGVVGLVDFERYMKCRRIEVFLWLCGW